MRERNVERIVLRELNLDDASFIFQLLNSPSWIKYIGDRGIENLSDAISYLEDGPLQQYREGKGLGLKAICLSKPKLSIGLCGLLQREYLNCPDIGYAILPEYERRGYTFRACKMILNEVRSNLQFDKIAAITSLDNEGSIRLLYKLGFQLIQEIEREGEVLNHFEQNL